MSNRIIQGYDGSINAPTSAVGSKVKRRGHKKEDVYAERTGGTVIKGKQKPDVKVDNYMDSVKGASKNIQLLLSSINQVDVYYDKDNPLNIYQRSAYKYRKFKKDNNNAKNLDLFECFIKHAKEVAEYLRNKKNFRNVIQKVFCNDYEADRLVILKEITEEAYRYNMTDVVDLYVNSNYEVHVTEGGKIVVRAGAVQSEKKNDRELEIFYSETRGGKNLGGMNHGVRSDKLYIFLKENLNYDVIPA